MFKENGLSYLFASVFFIVLLSFTSSINAQVFGNRVNLGLIEYDAIDEASGLAASRKNIDVLWTHNDGGDSNRIYALNTQGEHLGIYNIGSSITNRDWEDIAVGPGPLEGEHYIYIGDIGDNNAQYDLKYIHRVLEPKVSSRQTAIDTTLSDIETITFEYPDGVRDAEVVMVDPLTKDIYVVSKRETNVHVYRIPYPQSTTETITIDHVATLDLSGGTEPPWNWTVGGDISNSGLEIIIKTATVIYYWANTPGQNLWEAFNNTPINLPYILEPLGEGLAWAPDARGYYTLSEEPHGIEACLYFYPRTDEPVPVELSSFIAYQKSYTIELKWVTNSELNNYGFEIEKSTSKTTWKTIGFVQGQGTSNIVTDYSFIDENISNGNNYYRLKQIDYNGQFIYSQTIEVQVNDIIKFTLMQNYPNPFNSETNISFQLKNKQQVQITIHSIDGKHILNLANQAFEAGEHTIHWDGRNVSNTLVASGVYLVHLISDSFFETRKLILLR